MTLLQLVSALCLSAAAPNPGSELLDVDDKSLLRAMADEPARVVSHIRAQQRRIEWLEQELRQLAPVVNMQRTSQRRRLSGTEQEPRPESSSNQRTVNSLRAPPSDGCSECKAAAECYSDACHGGKMSTDGRFAQCAGLPRAICDMCVHLCM